MLKWFSAAKKTVQSKSVPKTAVFRKFKSLYIKYSNRDPEKALTYPERHILRKNPFKGVGCSLIEEPQKTKKKIVTSKGMAKSRIWGAEIPEPIATKFLHAGCRPGPNHTCQFW